MLLLLGACNASKHPEQPSAPPDVAAPTVHDSAGIRIVEHALDARDRAPRFTLDTLPITVVDERTTDLELGKLWRPLLLSDNRMAFFSDGSVFVIGADGKVAERIGQRGAGPGEFQGGRMIRGAGDTLLLNDIENARVSVIVPGVGVIRTVNITAQFGKIAFSPLGLVGKDTLLVGSNEGIGFRDPKSSSNLVPWFVGRIVMPTATPTPFDSLPGFALTKYLNGMVSQRYGTAGALAGWGGRILLVDIRNGSMRLRAGSGALMQRIRMPSTRRATDPESVNLDVERYITWLRTRTNVGVIKWDTARVFNNLRGTAPADSLPTFDRVLIGADGLAWFKDGGYEYADSTWGWTALRQDGTIAGRLTGTGRDRIEAFGTNAVLMRVEDEEGYTVLRVFRLRLPTP
ncbi:MAG: hypothetical protein IPP98_07580 [Gemmatimonadetes bacterium]|nr:hypothetical protein [Gemmatimonadota bacterium]